jgi:hypothetical protein
MGLVGGVREDRIATPTPPTVALIIIRLSNSQLPIPSQIFWNCTQDDTSTLPRSTQNSCIDLAFDQKKSSLGLFKAHAVMSVAMTIYQRALGAGKMPPILGNSTGATHENKCRQREITKW